MNKKMFFGALASCAFLAWLSGYDFNYRGENVALFTFMSICFSFIVSIAQDM